MTKTLTIMALFLAIGACSGTQKTADLPLKAPAGAPGAAAAAVDTGNSFFGDGQWGQARAQYETAMTIAPTLAEAHYDLALALDRLGKQAEALAHYKEAANLAPGNRLIWNARPFRPVQAEVGKGLLDKRIPHPDVQRPY